MPVHGRITSINSFATGKTERVPTSSAYIEDYFNVQTTFNQSWNYPYKITTDINFQEGADDRSDATGFIWYKKLDNNFGGTMPQHYIFTKLATPIDAAINNLSLIHISEPTRPY